jgi:hypothetical protein
LEARLRAGDAQRIYNNGIQECKACAKPCIALFFVDFSMTLFLQFRQLYKPCVSVR